MLLMRRTPDILALQPQTAKQQVAIIPLAYLQASRTTSMLKDARFWRFGQTSWNESLAVRWAHLLLADSRPTGPAAVPVPMCHALRPPRDPSSKLEVDKLDHSKFTRL